jgi:isopenicillin N synthase-like dioxygenase
MFIQIRKDDILGNCERLPAHPLIVSNNDLFKHYTLHCRAIIERLITLVENNLQLPVGTLSNIHRIDHRSGDHVRLTTTAVFPYSEERAKRGEHTDFGTFTLLFNWLSGLQINLPDNDGGYTDKWVWVKPIPGSAVINLGDACVKFTSGILRSNIHRVTSPIGPQAGLVRNSLVYFSRPEDDAPLTRLRGGLIDARLVVRGGDEGILSKDWILRRSLGDLTGVYTHKGGMDVRVYPGTGSAIQASGS